MKTTPHSNKLALYLALTAVLFGGAVMGAGNAISGLFEQPDPSAHAHHQHHQQSGDHPATDSWALPLILTMPAHCMFCIDGVTPTPIVLHSPIHLDTDGVHLLLATPPTLAANRLADSVYQSRAPPHHLS